MTKYKGYVGQFTVDTETGLIRGEVINTRDVITFYGVTVPEAEQAFRDSVDDYLDFCKEQGDEPEKPYSGRLLVRLAPELHQELDILARSRGKSVNKLISGCLARMAQETSGRLRDFGLGKGSEEKDSLKGSQESSRSDALTILGAAGLAESCTSRLSTSTAP